MSLSPSLPSLEPSSPRRSDCEQRGLAALELLAPPGAKMPPQRLATNSTLGPLDAVVVEHAA